MSDASVAENKRIAQTFWETAFRDARPGDAAEQFLGETYIQHNPQTPDGPEAFVAAIEGMHGAAPDFSGEVKRAIGEDDLVVLHSHVKMSAEDPGTAVVDIFRVADGKVVEHWDVLQPIPAEAANDNTMF
jgi:predicted SnoaL-like aldol condensation-catalyzing enzyme